MVEIKEVKTKKQKALFVDFPVKMYKGVWNFVAPMRLDELNNFSEKKNANSEQVDMIYFLAYKDGKLVGRICGIVQKAYNSKMNCKRARFSRFDCIDDKEVSRALFSAVENWAKQKGMDTVHGPLGFNDLDREGLLIEGFDQPQTFEEDYTHPYYPELVEDSGYGKENDWLEYHLYPPKVVDPRIDRIAEAVLKRYDLHIAKEKNTSKFLKKYGDGIFEVLDEAYSPLLGVVPMTEKLKKQILSSFKLVINIKYVIAICDKNDRVIAFGLGLPSMSKAFSKSGGRIVSPYIFSLLKGIKHPKIIDLSLEGVRPEYQNKGINALIVRFLMNVMIDGKLDYCETNHSLEDNIKIHQQWEVFERFQNKRRRCYIKNI